MKWIFFALPYFLALTVAAQSPTDFRTEQVYLAPKHHIYSPGDTIELEGMVTCIAMERFLPYSRYLYVELFNENNSLLLRQKVSCKDNGYFNTRFPVAHELPEGVYYLRGYTHFMKNFSPQSFAVQPLLVGKQFPISEAPLVEPSCQVAFQGGSMAAGYLQTLAVRLSDWRTFPLSVPLSLISEKGDTLLHAHTSASGLALLHFIPQPGVRYSLTGYVGETPFCFSLPLPSKAPKIQGSTNGKRVSYQIQNGEGNLEEYRLYTFDRRNGLLELSHLKQEGVILLEQEPKVLSLFLTDIDQNILSECAVAGRGKIRNGLQAPDVLRVGDSLHYCLPSLSDGSRVMVRVFPENDLLISCAESTLDYLSDYNSPFPFPKKEYTDDLPCNDLQAWLCSAHFKRFSLKELVEQDTAIYVYLPEQIMAFSGRIKKSEKFPWKEGTLVAYHTENGHVYDTDVDSSGRFVMAVDDFMEGESFFLQAMTSKGEPKSATIHLDEEKYPQFVNAHPFCLPRPHNAEIEVSVATNIRQDYILDKEQVRNYIFPELTVKARSRVKEPLKDTNDFYQVNSADRIKIEKRNFLTLYDIVRDMPGLEVRKDEDGNVCLFSNRGPSVLGGSNALPIIVDKDRFSGNDCNFVLQMSAFEIESVELLRPWQALIYMSGAINGAILVKTRDYKEHSNLPAKGSMYSPLGLSSFSGKAFFDHPWVASYPGRYRLVIDVLTTSGVQSYEHCFEVIE